MCGFSAQINIKRAAFICIAVIIHLHIRSGLSGSSPAVVYIIFTHPHICIQSACFLIKIITIFTNFLPSCCHSGIRKEIISLSSVAQPAVGNCHTWLIEIIRVFRSCSPAVAEHNSILPVVIIPFPTWFQPACIAFSILCAVITLTFVGNFSPKQFSLGIIKIIVFSPLHPAMLFRSDTHSRIGSLHIRSGPHRRGTHGKYQKQKTDNPKASFFQFLLPPHFNKKS